MRGRVTGVIFVAILFVFGVNCNDIQRAKPTELVEVKSTDEYGNVKARVMARSVPSNSDDSEGAGADDEDSKSTSEGSGDADINSDHLQDAVFNDQPMNVLNNNGTSTASTILISPSPSTTTRITKQISSTMTEPVTSTETQSSPGSNITIAKTESTPQQTPQQSPTSSKSIVIKPTSTITTTQVASSTGVTESPSSMSTEVTTEAKTTVKATTGERSTTSKEEFPTTQANVNKPSQSTSITINGTREPIVIGKNTSEKATVSTEVKKTDKVEPAPKSTESSANVNAHQDPTEKPRKTLFGFVTVEILIALLAGALFSILLVAFLVYRLKKRNEGSYELSETIALRPKELDEMGANKEVFV